MTFISVCSQCHPDTLRVSQHACDGCSEGLCESCAITNGIHVYCITCTNEIEKAKKEGRDPVFIPF